jgi:signal transduction histidine kinase
LDVPVLAITAQTDSATVKRAYRCGVSDFIAKPFGVDLLEAKLKMWLRLSQLGDFAHQMRDFTHEAKNPLAAIAAAAQVMARKDADADPALRRRLLRTIEEEADRLGRLLSTYTLGETAGEATATLSPLRLIQDVVEVNLPDPAVRARVHVRCTAPIPAIRVDPDRLRQMLVNLIENAVAATLAGGEVAIESFVEPGGVALLVRDSGVGIPAAHLPRIFEDGFTTRGGTARGLGLGITQRLCQAAGGKIQVESTLGQGSSFALWFPR